VTDFLALLLALARLALLLLILHDSFLLDLLRLR
jgi:hypothetical protein